MPQKTLADTLSARETLYVNCAHPVCCKSTKLDVQALIDRLGADHGSMHQDLVGLFGGSNCMAAGRDRRPVFFSASLTMTAKIGSAIATGRRLSIVEIFRLVAKVAQTLREKMRKVGS